MELNKNYDFPDEGAEIFKTDVNNDFIAPTDRDYYTSMDISLPFATNTSRYNLFEDGYGEKCKASTSRISMISENQTTENFLKEFDCFYTEMMGKVKGLKDVPALKSVTYPEDLDINEELLYKNLKDTPEVQEQLNNIKKLDDEINNVLSQYKIEKDNRLQTQYEMCNEIAKNNTLPERDTDLFLNLCQFEFSDGDGEQEKNEKTSGDNKKQTSDQKRTTNAEEKISNNFIMRNIFLAKEGIFANSSLTDEEKFKLEELLLMDDECESPKKYKNPFTLPNIENKFKNAYKFTESESKKVDEIDSELEKFKLDESNNEKDEFVESSKKNNGLNVNSDFEIEKLNDFMLEQRLKMLETKLKTLHESEKSDLEKLTTKTTENENSDDELINIQEFMKFNYSSDTEENGTEEKLVDTMTEEDKELQEMYEKLMKERHNFEETEEDFSICDEQNDTDTPDTSSIPKKSNTTNIPDDENK